MLQNLQNMLSTVKVAYSMSLSQVVLGQLVPKANLTLALTLCPNPKSTLILTLTILC